MLSWRTLILFNDIKMDLSMWKNGRRSSTTIRYPVSSEPTPWSGENKRKRRKHQEHLEGQEEKDLLDLNPTYS
jgi:hypothetical protein